MFVGLVGFVVKHGLGYSNFSGLGRAYKKLISHTQKFPSLHAKYSCQQSLD